VLGSATEKIKAVKLIKSLLGIFSAGLTADITGLSCNWWS